MPTNDADLEYGPTPETADHEHTDIEPSIAWKFGIWLGVATVISAGIVFGTFWYFESSAETANRAAQIFPLAAGQLREPPGPHLQTQPFRDIYMLRQTEQEKLTTYGWVDKSTGIVRIPIEDALRLTAQQGLPTRTEQPGELNQVVMDSSAGRTTASR